MNLRGHTRLDLIQKGKVVHRIEQDNTTKCPICGMELEITDKLEPYIWTVYCPRYVCILPFYVKEGITRESALKTFFSAADTWERDHKEEVEQFKKQLHASMEK